MVSLVATGSLLNRPVPSRAKIFIVFSNSSSSDHYPLSQIYFAVPIIARRDATAPRLNNFSVLSATPNRFGSVIPAAILHRERILGDYATHNCLEVDSWLLPSINMNTQLVLHISGVKLSNSNLLQIHNHIRVGWNCKCNKGDNPTGCRSNFRIIAITIAHCGMTLPKYQ